MSSPTSEYWGDMPRNRRPSDHSKNVIHNTNVCENKIQVVWVESIHGGSALVHFRPSIDSLHTEPPMRTNDSLERILAKD